MANSIDLQGMRFGRLFVVEKNGKAKNGSIIWKCRCDCGKETMVTSCNLIHADACTMSLFLLCLKNMDFPIRDFTEFGEVLKEDVLIIKIVPIKTMAVGV